MKKMIPVFLLLCFQGHTQESNLIIDSLSHKQIPKKLIIITFNANSIQARKNKKVLFGRLADSLVKILDHKMGGRFTGEILIEPQIVSNPENNDTIYFKLIDQYGASLAIVIKDLNAYFEQTGVEVVKESDGKKRTASYNIHSDVTYILYDSTSKIKESQTKVWEFFTERNVVSGLLAAGPDIVGKSKDAFKIIQLNAEQYIKEIASYLRRY